MTTARAWTLALIPVALVAGLIVALMLTTGSLFDEPRASTPTPTTTVPIRPPTATGTLAQVVPIENLPPEIPFLSIQDVLAERGVTLTDSAYLGQNGDYVAYGYATSEGEVCVSLWTVSLGSGEHTCVGSGEFAKDGLVVDRGSWQLRWTVDGTVEWLGL